jgi:hypothetical protein
MALNFPASPSLHQIYTVGDQSWKWDGTAWVALSSAEESVPVYVGTLPPTYSVDGYLWWDSDTGQLYVRYQSTWVAATVPPTSSILDSDAVIDAILSELTLYSDQAAAVAGGVPVGGLYKVPGSGIGAIRAVV